MKIINSLSVVSLAAFELQMSAGFVQLKPMSNPQSLSNVYMVGMPMRKSPSGNNLQKIIPKTIKNDDRRAYWDLCTQDSNSLSSKTEESSENLPLKKYIKKLTKEAFFQIGSHLTEIQVSLADKKKVK